MAVSFLSRRKTPTDTSTAASAGSNEALVRVAHGSAGAVGNTEFLPLVRRELEAFEDKFDRQVRQLTQKTDQVMEVVMQPPESNSDNIGAMECKISDLSGAVRALQEELTQQVRRTDAVDQRMKKWRSTFECEVKTQIAELKQEIAELSGASRGFKEGLEVCASLSHKECRGAGGNNGSPIRAIADGSAPLRPISEGDSPTRLEDTTEVTAWHAAFSRELREDFVELRTELLQRYAAQEERERLDAEAALKSIQDLHKQVLEERNSNGTRYSMLEQRVSELEACSGESNSQHERHTRELEITHRKLEEVTALRSRDLRPPPDVPTRPEVEKLITRRLEATLLQHESEGVSARALQLSVGSVDGGGLELPGRVGDETAKIAALAGEAAASRQRIDTLAVQIEMTNSRLDGLVGGRGGGSQWTATIDHSVPERERLDDLVRRLDVLERGVSAGATGHRFALSRLAAGGTGPALYNIGSPGLPQTPADHTGTAVEQHTPESAAALADNLAASLRRVRVPGEAGAVLPHGEVRQGLQDGVDAAGDLEEIRREQRTLYLMLTDLAETQGLGAAELVAAAQGAGATELGDENCEGRPRAGPVVQAMAKATSLSAEAVQILTQRVEDFQAVLAEVSEAVIDVRRVYCTLEARVQGVERANAAPPSVRALASPPTQTVTQDATGAHGSPTARSLQLPHLKEPSSPPLPPPPSVTAPAAPPQEELVKEVVSKASSNLLSEVGPQISQLVSSEMKQLASSEMKQLASSEMKSRIAAVEEDLAQQRQEGIKLATLHRELAKSILHPDGTMTGQATAEIGARVNTFEGKLQEQFDHTARLASLHSELAKNMQEAKAAAEANESISRKEVEDIVREAAADLKAGEISTMSNEFRDRVERCWSELQQIRQENERVSTFLSKTATKDVFEEDYAKQRELFTELGSRVERVHSELQQHREDMGKLAVSQSELSKQTPKNDELAHQRAISTELAARIERLETDWKSIGDKMAEDSSASITLRGEMEARLKTSEGDIRREVASSAARCMKELSTLASLCEDHRCAAEERFIEVGSRVDVVEREHRRLEADCRTEIDGRVAVLDRKIHSEVEDRITHCKLDFQHVLTEGLSETSSRISWCEQELRGDITMRTARLESYLRNLRHDLAALGMSPMHVSGPESSNLQQGWVSDLTSRPLSEPAAEPQRQSSTHCGSPTNPPQLISSSSEAHLRASQGIRVDLHSSFGSMSAERAGGYPAAALHSRQPGSMAQAWAEHSASQEVAYGSVTMAHHSHTHSSLQHSSTSQMGVSSSSNLSMSQMEAAATEHLNSLTVDLGDTSDCGIDLASLAAAALDEIPGSAGQEAMHEDAKQGEAKQEEAKHEEPASKFRFGSRFGSKSSMGVASNEPGTRTPPMSPERVMCGPLATSTLERRSGASEGGATPTGGMTPKRHSSPIQSHR